MKKIIMFFIGLLLLVLILAALFFASALYDAGDVRRIDAFVFQPNNLSTDRIGRPVAVEQLSDKFIRERLIRKFVHEYFYVNPDAENIALRTRSDSVMAALSSGEVFENWQRDVAPQIEEMADQKMLRTVTVNDEILMPSGSDYWDVFYELKTWNAANDMDLQPTSATGVLHLQITFTKGIRDQRGGSSFDVQKYLSGGGDPAAIFKFRVDQVKR